MDKEVTVKNKAYTVRHFTIKQRLDLNNSSKSEDAITYSIRALEYGTSLTKEQILNLSGDVADELFVEVLEHNKPPLELLQRLQPTSTPTTAPS